MRKFVIFFFVLLVVVCVSCTTFRARIGELKDGEIEISKSTHQFIGVMI